MTNILEGTEETNSSSSEVFLEEFTGDIIAHILLANASRNGEI